MTDFATKNLIKFYSGVQGDEVSIAEIVDKTDFIRPTVMNYVRDLAHQGLITQKTSPNHKLKVESIVLTEAGRIILNGHPKAAHPTQTTLDEPSEPLSEEMTELELLDRATEVTDEFNRRSHKWEWVMKRKEVGSQ